MTFSSVSRESQIRNTEVWKGIEEKEKTAHWIRGLDPWIFFSFLPCFHSFTLTSLIHSHTPHPSSLNPNPFSPFFFRGPKILGFLPLPNQLAPTKSSLCLANSRWCANLGLDYCEIKRGGRGLVVVVGVAVIYGRWEEDYGESETLLW